MMKATKKLALRSEVHSVAGGWAPAKRRSPNFQVAPAKARPQVLLQEATPLQRPALIGATPEASQGRPPLRADA